MGCLFHFIFKHTEHLSRASEVIKKKSNKQKKMKYLISFRNESVLILLLAVFNFILKVGQANTYILHGTKMCHQDGLWISSPVENLILVLCACA